MRYPDFGYTKAPSTIKLVANVNLSVSCFASLNSFLKTVRAFFLAITCLS
jgi:hypothetical protein